MGGFFSTPEPSLPPAPTAMADPEEEARKAREDIQNRNRRGRAGLIVTSEQGVAEPTLGSGKTLLGG